MPIGDGHCLMIAYLVQLGFYWLVGPMKIQVWPPSFPWVTWK